MRLRLIPNGRDHQIETVKLIREFTGMGLREAKEAMEMALPIDVPEVEPDNPDPMTPSGTFRELVQKAPPHATIVIGQYPLATGPHFERKGKPLPDDVSPALAPLETLAEVRALRHEVAGLRKHLGMIAHE